MKSDKTEGTQQVKEADFQVDEEVNWDRVLLFILRYRQYLNCTAPNGIHR
jgi:hypothetical protein